MYKKKKTEPKVHLKGTWYKIVDELKKEHEGKRVNGGVSASYFGMWWMMVKHQNWYRDWWHCHAYPIKNGPMNTHSLPPGDPLILRLLQPTIRNSEMSASEDSA